MKTMIELYNELARIKGEIHNKKVKLCDNVTEIIEYENKRMTAKEICDSLAKSYNEEINPVKLGIVLGSYECRDKIYASGLRDMTKISYYLVCDENGRIIDPTPKKKVTTYRVNTYFTR